MNKRKVLSLALTLSLCAALLTVPAQAANGGYDDTTGHWAEGSIERWSGYNIVEGDDGHFHPDQALTRGAMAKILANTLGLTDEGAKNPFADVPADAWYTPYVLRCYAAGIMEGDGVNANPNAPITRQETMTVLCRALNIAPVEDADLSAYADGGTVADWAAPYAAAMTEAGIIKGIGENQLAPTQDVTRGSIMAVLDRAVAEYINTPGSYDLTGKTGLVLVASGDVTFTGKTAANILVTQAATGKEVTFDKAKVTGSVTVLADNAKVLNKNKSALPEIVAVGKGVKTETVKPKRTSSGGGGSSGGGSSTPSTPTYTNLTIAEAKTVTETATYQDVTITDAVGDGTVSLANMTILGNLYINGGGASTVNLTNVTIKGKIIMAKVGGQTPRLHLTNTPVSAVEVDQPATIEADAASAVTAVQAKADVYVIGADTVVTTLTIPANVESAVNVTVTAGTVAKVEAKSETAVTGAANAVAQVVAEAPVTVAADAVAKVEVPATAGEGVTVAVTGSGSVDVAVNSANGAAITTDGENGASVTVSTDLTTPPTITVDGTAVTHIHKWDEGKVTTAPTCTDQGVKTYTCIAEGCPDADKVTEGDQPATKTEAIPALGHTEVIDSAVAATCTEAGKTEGKHCSVCNTVLAAQETVPAKGHTWGQWTLKDDQNHTRTCSACNATEDEAHTEVTDPAVAATCTEAGKTEGKHCSVCNGVLTAQETVPALGHDFTGAWITDADGHWHKCTRCDVTDEKAAHTYPADASCDAAANCTVCNYEKAAGTHAWDEGKVTTAPTCTDKGVKTFTCGVCKQTKTEDVDALGHTEVIDPAVAATCTETGKTEGKHCSVCDAVLTAQETVPALGHTWDDGVITTEPTEDKEGVKTFTCFVCKATKTEAVPMAPSITLSVANNQIKIDFSKPEDCTQFGLYCYDSEEKQVGYSYMYDGFPDAAVVLPTPTQSGVYTLVIKGWGDNVETKEVARLENGFDIKIEGSAVEYTMAFDTSGSGNHTATLADTPSGVSMRYVWTSGEKTTGGACSVNTTVQSNHVAQEGDIFDLRVITSYEVENNVVKVVMTPPATKTYTAPTE